MGLETIDEARLIAELADRRSFGAAADRLGQSKGGLSRKLVRIEERLGLRLFARNTRAVQITPEGAMVLDHARRLIAEYEAFRVSLETQNGAPSGELRVTAPNGAGQAMMGPAIAEFLAAAPTCTVTVELTNRTLDLIGEGFDVAIRLRDPGGQGLISRRLATVGFGLFATPAAAANLSVGGNDPVPVACLPALVSHSGEPLELTGPNGAARVPIRRVLCVNDPLTLFAAGIDGAFAVYGPTLLGRTYVEDGRMVDLMPGHVGHSIEFFAVTPERQLMRPAVRLFLDTLYRQFRERARDAA